MFKLLTEEWCLKIEKEYKLRRAVIVLSWVIAVLGITLAGLMPSYVLSSLRYREVTERVRIIEESSFSEEGSELEEWLTETDLRLKALAPVKSSDKPLYLIEKALAEKPAGVSITNILWSNQNGQKSLSISGVAGDRQALLSFERRLNDSNTFSQVVLPVSNLAKDRDINFEINLLEAKTQ